MLFYVRMKIAFALALLGIVVVGLNAAPNSGDCDDDGDNGDNGCGPGSGNGDSSDCSSDELIEIYLAILDCDDDGGKTSDCSSESKSSESDGDLIEVALEVDDIVCLEVKLL